MIDILITGSEQEDLANANVGKRIWFEMPETSSKGVC